MRSRDAPIGVFDSGLGGLSVVHELWRELPRESIHYVADSANCPYGERASAFIRARSLAICEALVDRGVKAIVVACNTATAGALDLLRERIALPIIGLEPAVKPATALTVTGKIAVLSTPVTSRSPRLADLLGRYGVGLDIRSIGMPGLADRVEAGEGDSAEVVEQLREVITPLVADGVDTIVLGCTHYPFLAATLAAIAGDAVRVVDSSNAVARRVRDLLISGHNLAPPPRLGTFVLETSGDPVVVADVASRLLRRPVAASPFELTGPAQAT
jgi:glutamate racemase